jgi:hypothetical protein
LHRRHLRPLPRCFALAALGAPGARAELPAAQRLARDARPGVPLVAHVFVALCDHDHQGIVPVPRHLGNGQDPAGNLYWGARYGVRTYLTRDAGWRRVESTSPAPAGVLERLV